VLIVWFQTQAVENGHEEVVRVLLEEGGFDVSTYRLRCRPILYACRVGSLSIAKLLIQHGTTHV
jgi:ankyrin repeat protein